MIKTVAIFWLWWQGKQFLRYFTKDYNVIWICRTSETKEKIENEFWIKVYTSYKECLNEGIDLLVLCAYPILIYEEILDYSKDYNYKILSDLPLTFDLDLLEIYIKNQRLYLFLLETKTEFYKNYYLENKEKIVEVNCLILQNRENLKKQKFKRESVIVDSHYMLNNLIWIDNKILKINYKFIEREVMDVEYIIELKLRNSRKIVYKYQDGQWIIIEFDEKLNIIDKKKNRITFDLLLNEIIEDIENGINTLNEEYFKNFTYLLTNLNYENKNI